LRLYLVPFSFLPFHFFILFSPRRVPTIRVFSFPPFLQNQGAFFYVSPGFSNMEGCPVFRSRSLHDLPLASRPLYAPPAASPSFDGDPDSYRCFRKVHRGALPSTSPPTIEDEPIFSLLFCCCFFFNLLSDFFMMAFTAPHARWYEFFNVLPTMLACCVAFEQQPFPFFPPHFFFFLVRAVWRVPYAKELLFSSACHFCVSQESQFYTCLPPVNLLSHHLPVPYHFGSPTFPSRHSHQLFQA